MTRRSTITSVLTSLLEDLGSDASRRAYRSDWAAYTTWLKSEKVSVLKATPRDVKRYVAHLASLGKAMRTRGRALSVVREVYRALVAEELLAINPAREIKNTKQGRGAERTTWLEEADLRKVLAFGAPNGPVGSDGRALKEGFFLRDGKILYRQNGKDLPLDRVWTDRRDRMCIQLLAGTGRRRSEVARMRLEDVSQDGVTGKVKGGGIKTAPVQTWLRKEIADWCAFAGIKKGPLLPRAPDDPEAISGDRVYLIVKRVAKAVGIDKIAPHGLRRSLATLSERRGVPLADIQTQLSHLSVSTTETYLKGSRKVERAPGEWMGERVKAKGVTS